jgi:hypothetical protein
VHVPNPIRWLRTKSRRFVIAFVACLSVLALGGAAAFAYYVIEAAGSGSQTAPLGGGETAALTFSISAIDANGSLIPGGESPIYFSAQSPTTNNVVLNAISGTVNSTSVSGCNPDWFTVSPGTLDNGDGIQINLPYTLSGSNGAASVNDQSSVTPWELHFNDSGTDQSACENATVTVQLTAS